jgi:catechol 2,3-dioxygenase-like lactoylglutathione lyase family enzyme
VPDLLVNIDVDDLEKAIAFYTSAFGLKVGRRFGRDAAELLGRSAPLYLLAQPAGSRATASTGQPRDYARHWTSVHLDFVVGDVDVAVERAAAAGANL